MKLPLAEHSRLTMEAIGGSVPTSPTIRSATDRVFRDETRRDIRAGIEGGGKPTKPRSSVHTPSDLNPSDSPAPPDDHEDFMALSEDTAEAMRLFVESRRPVLMPPGIPCS